MKRWWHRHAHSRSPLRHSSNGFAKRRHLITQIPSSKKHSGTGTAFGSAGDTGKTAVLPNSANPFTPETWIPYQLAVSSDVTRRALQYRKQDPRNAGGLAYLPPADIGVTPATQETTNIRCFRRDGFLSSGSVGAALNTSCRARTQEPCAVTSRTHSILITNTPTVSR